MVNASQSGAFVCYILFFFFQAEDGIRYLTVTGVQTCALPIFSIGRPARLAVRARPAGELPRLAGRHLEDRKSTRLNSSHSQISYAVFCFKKKKTSMERPGPTRPGLFSNARRRARIFV